MNLIKHIANLLALWTIPFVIVLFFMVITAFGFTYSEAINSEVFIVLNTIYSLSMAIAYMVFSHEEDCQGIKLFKTK